MVPSGLSVTAMVRKLIVEVVAAKALMPKDGQGSTNAYCVVRLCTLCFSFCNISFVSFYLKFPSPCSVDGLRSSSIMWWFSWCQPTFYDYSLVAALSLRVMVLGGIYIDKFCTSFQRVGSPI